MNIRWISRCVFVILFAASLPAQSSNPPTSPHFEVASVKATVDPNAAGLITRMTGDRGYHGVNMPLIAYVRVAYQLHTNQITAPDWIGAENFDIEAKAEKPSTVDELHIMLQNLLEERFHMKIRHESREQAGYVLVVEKGGHKMKDHDPEDKRVGPIMPGSGMHVGSNVTMTYLAFYLSNELERTVVDKTALGGHYDFECTWINDVGNMPMPAGIPPGPPDGTAPPPPGPQARAVPAGVILEGRGPVITGPNLFNALKLQLGLRLDPAKVPTEHLVVDHIEKLTEN